VRHGLFVINYQNVTQKPLLPTIRSLTRSGEKTMSVRLFHQLAAGVGTILVFAVECLATVPETRNPQPGGRDRKSFSPADFWQPPDKK